MLRVLGIADELALTVCIFFTSGKREIVTLTLLQLLNLIELLLLGGLQIHFLERLLLGIQFLLGSSSLSLVLNVLGFQKILLCLSPTR